MDVTSLAQHAFSSDAKNEGGEIRVYSDSPRLHSIAAKVTDIRGRAKSAAARSGQQIKDIRDDTNLSAEGKQNAIDDIKARDTETMKGLLNEELSVLETEIAALDRKLEGQVGFSSSDLIAFRDAQDRSDRLANGDEALRAMERAIRSGDRTLAHAIYRRSTEVGWRSPLAPFAAAYPDAAKDWNDLLNIRHLRNEGGMSRALAYSTAATVLR